jgi:hypothetical protein
MSACFGVVTSATVAWDAVHTLLRLLGRLSILSGCYDRELKNNFPEILHTRNYSYEKQIYGR